MPIFPTDYATEIVSTRSAKFWCDDGTTPGWATGADILAALRADDMVPKLLTADYVPKVIPATATTYTLLADDKNKYLIFLCSGSCLVNVPTGLSANFEAAWVQWGAGTLTWQPAVASGLNVRSTDGLRSALQYGEGAIKQVMPGEWLLSGYLQV